MANPRTIHQMKVEKIIDHTPSVRELRLKCTDTHFEFKAGQFAMIHVPQSTGKPALRAYSIASTDQQKDGFTLLFKFVGRPSPELPDGVASTYIWSLKGDETLQITGPFGKVFFQEPPTEQIVFLNTGTGLSQHYCYLVSKAEQYPNLKYKLYFGVRTEADIYYQKELEELKKKLPHFEYEYVLSRPSASWTGKKGYVQNFLDEIDYKNTPTTFYLCGNGGMIKETKHKLIDQEGLDKTRIWAEAFD